jgi:hypothetical protein
VILQIGYYKADGREAPLPDGPLHHHFELVAGTRRRSRSASGSSGILAAMLGVTLFLASVNRLVTRMTRRRRPIDLDALGLATCWRALRGRPVTVLGFARSGIALARFLGDAGRFGDGLRRATCGRARGAVARSRVAPWRSRWVRTWIPAVHVGGRCLVVHLAVDQPGLPDHRAAPARRSSELVARGRPAIARPLRPRLRARPLPAPLPIADDRGDRHEGQDDDRRRSSARSWPSRSAPPERCSAGTSGCPSSSASRS